MNRNDVVQNLSAANTYKLRAGLAGAVSRTHRGRVVIIGDSYASGFMSNGPTHFNETHSRFGAVLARNLEARGWNVKNDSFIGDGVFDDTTTAMYADQRLSYEGAEIYTDGPYMAGGHCWSLNAPGTGFTFHPAHNFDTAEVIIPVNGGPGGLAIFFYGDSFNGDAVGQSDVQLYDVSGDAGVRKVYFTVPQGLVTDGVAGKARSIQFKSNELGNAFVTGATTFDSTDPGLDIIVIGAAGGRMADWSAAVDYSGYNDTTFNVRPMLAALCDDVANVPTTFIVQGWANDWEVNKISTDDANALAARMIAMLEPYGDVFWLGYGPMNPNFGDENLAVLNQPYDAAVFKAATDAGHATIDPEVLFPDWDTANGLGLISDSEHLSAAGHTVVARAIEKAFDLSF